MGEFTHRQEHERNIDWVIEETVKQANIPIASLDAIAVTQGPVGIDKAVALSKLHNVPILGINHMEGHALAARFEKSVAFPFLLLLVSGGHTELLICSGVGQYRKLGETLDDAVGDAFDKGARLLGLVFGENNQQPGAVLESMAKRGVAVENWALPMIQHRDFNFSFAGMKTRFRHLVDSKPDWTFQDKCNLANTYQTALVGHIVERTKRGLFWCQTNDIPISSLVVSGGVAQNSFLRKQLSVLAASFKANAVYPSPKLCSDNGIMIAWAGHERLSLGLTANVDELRLKQRWSLDPSLERPIYVNKKKTNKMNRVAPKAEVVPQSPP